MTTTPGVAGRTDYREWDKVTSDLVKEADEGEEQEKLEAARALGLDGKYAVSAAEAEERRKAKEVAQAKQALDGYRKREAETMANFEAVLGPVERGEEEGKGGSPTTFRITRDNLDAGKRVATICNSAGVSQEDTIILTQDLSHLESKIKLPPVAPKSYPDDAENTVAELPTKERTIHGLIKLFVTNMHNCTIIVRCKLITMTVEVSHCSNVLLKIEKEATVATIQCDLCQGLAIEFHDAPSGKNSGIPGQPKMFWGDDRDDRIYHAGVSDMKVSLFRDGFVESSTTADYMKDGAEAVGNATPEESQFVTSALDGSLVTEKVVRHGGTTGSNARAMTQRELDEEKVRRDKAVEMAIEKAESMIKITTKDGKEVPVVKKTVPDKEEGAMEEVYGSMCKSDIDAIVAECEENKARGNEAFGGGEYAQAVLLYSLALDKAAELPDSEAKGDKQLFPRHIVLANRSAAFLKLGDHPKALEDGVRAQERDPTYVKGVFRRGLALHAMGKYREAIQFLSEAQKIEPKNKQIKQALHFAEVRMTQEMRKRAQQ